MKKILVVVAAMVVAVFVASSVYAEDVKGTVKVDGAKVQIVKDDGKTTLEVAGAKIEDVKKLDKKAVEVKGDVKDGKITVTEVKEAKAAAAAPAAAPAKK